MDRAGRPDEKEAYDMGYDMHWIRKPEGEAEAVAAASEIFYAAANARDAIPREERGQFSEEEWSQMRAGKWIDIPESATERYRTAQEEVLRLSRAMGLAERSYFRLNVWGMSKVGDAMVALGAGYEDYSRSECPAWPNAPEDYWDLEDDERAAKYPEVVAAHQAVRDWSPRDVGAGIPMHKFSTNDGWHVLPEECFVAASKIRALDVQHVLKVLVDVGINNEGWLETWNDWVQWLADASEHGGFEVH